MINNGFLGIILVACMDFVILQVGIGLAVLAVSLRNKRAKCVVSAVIAGVLLAWSILSFLAIGMEVNNSKEHYLSEMNGFFSYYAGLDSKTETNGDEYIEYFDEHTNTRDDGSTYSFNMFLWRDEWYSNYVFDYVDVPKGYETKVVAYFLDNRSGEEEIKEVIQSSTESGYDVLMIDDEVYCVTEDIMGIVDFYYNYPEDKLVYELGNLDMYIIKWKYADIIFDKQTFDALLDYTGNETKVKYADTDKEYYIARMSGDKMLCDYVWFYQIGDAVYIKKTPEKTNNKYDDAYQLDENLAGKVKNAYRQYENTFRN